MNVSLWPKNITVYSDKDSWLGARLGKIGASDSPAIFAVIPGLTPVTAYARIMGLEEYEETEAQWWGHAHEPNIIKRFEQVYGKPVRQDVGPWAIITHADYPWMTCTPDALLKHEESGVECKAWASTKGWGPSGGTEIPDSVNLQVHHQMVVADAQFWYVAALLMGNDFRCYRIERNPALAGMVVQIEKEFYQDYVEPRLIPPLDGSDAASRLVARSFPVAMDKTIQAATAEQARMIGALSKATDEFKKAEEYCEHLKNELKASIGRSYGVTCDAGKAVWLNVNPSPSFDEKAFLRDHPMTEAQLRPYLKPRSGYRTLRLTFKEGE